jgi:hypothetical protein
MNRPEEEYSISYPNIYARGILFGSMYMEMGDTAIIKCLKTNLSCEIEFKVKGFFSGTYNGLGGKVKDDSTGEVLFNISGKWSDVLFIQKPTWPNKDEFFNVETSKIQPKIVVEEAEMNEFESRALWTRVTSAILSRDLDLATEEKTMIEDNQRSIEKQRTEGGNSWENQFFKLDETSGKWEFRGYFTIYLIRFSPINYDDTAAAKTEIRDYIFGKPRLTQYNQFWGKETENSSE